LITICKSCGQPVFTADDSILPRVKRRILNAVRRCPGIDAERLRGVVWADDPNGGPECRHALYVHINQLNKRIAPLGIVVRAERGGSTGYRIHSVKQKQ
jgi:hypothetical protein